MCLYLPCAGIRGMCTTAQPEINEFLNKKMCHVFWSFECYYKWRRGYLSILCTPRHRLLKQWTSRKSPRILLKRKKSWREPAGRWVGMGSQRSNLLDIELISRINIYNFPAAWKLCEDAIESSVQTPGWGDTKTPQSWGNWTNQLFHIPPV